MAEVVRVEEIVGNADDPALHHALHRLKHARRVEYIASVLMTCRAVGCA